jgi:hypothetical protein
MQEMATEDIVIGILASLGVLLLIVVFVYVLRMALLRKD